MELGSHCGLCETDIDWERTSQVPELGFFCQPAIPATHPRIRWQRKLSFPPAMSHWLHSGMSGKEVTDHVCSLSLSVFHICLFLTPPPLFFFFLSLSKSDLPNRKQARKGHSSRFQLPTRPDTSVRTCQGWLKWGRLPWQQFCHLPPAHVLRGRRRRRRRLSHHHHSLFSLCSPREIVPLEHTNGSVEVISLNLPDTSNKQETLSHEVWILFFNELLCRSWHC